MNELQVKVQQQPGAIQWNFEELKVALGNEMKRYEAMVYDEKSVGDAKKDVASLRKLKTAVEDKRKGIKEECLKPYEAIEIQAKELVKLIDKPIELIDKQVKEYERIRKENCKKAILEYMKKAFAEIPEAIASKGKTKLYDPRWENATAKKKDWTSAIDERVAGLKADLSVLEEIEEEFREDAKTAYSGNLLLADAMKKVSELRVQKEKILEAERKRKAAEEAEQKRIQEEENARRVAEAGYAKEVDKPAPQSPIGKVIDSIDRGNFATATQQTPQPQPKTVIDQSGNAVSGTITANEISAELSGAKILAILASDEQYKKIKDYIKFIGADYREV